jgi:hypothetical protein
LITVDERICEYNSFDIENRRMIFTIMRDFTVGAVAFCLWAPEDPGRRHLQFLTVTAQLVCQNPSKREGKVALSFN